MEAAFGEDFSGVRAYTGRAGEVLPAGARALAAREAIAFADRAPGRQTVAHELAHVVQARNAGPATPPDATSRPGDAGEREACEVGRAVAAGGPGRVRLAAAAALHGDWIDDAEDVERAARRAVRRVAGPCAGLAAADAFVAHGRYGPGDFVGGGGIGGITAYYDPLDGDGVLTIEVRAAVRFHDSLTIASGRVVPGLPTPAFRRLAARLSALPRARRDEAVARYQWTEAERGTGGSWIGTLVPLIRGRWGGQHRFFLNLPHHEWIGARVRIDLQAEDRERAAGDHLRIDAWKVPEGESLQTFGQTHHLNAGDPADARDQSMQIPSTALGPKEYAELRVALPFAQGSAAVVGRARELADRFVRLGNGAVGHPAHRETSVVLEAHANAAEEASPAGASLARRRAEAVRNYLAGHGFRDVDSRVRLDVQGAAGTDPANRSDPAGRRVDVVLDGGERKVTALHEFGHAFGIDDEYADATGPIGSEPDHHPMARDMTDASGARLPGAVVEHNAGVMSWGNEVRPQYYALFHHALTRLTREFEWALGTPRPRSAAADACTAAGGTPAAPPGTSGTDVGSAGVPEAPAPPAGSAAPAPSP